MNPPAPATPAGCAAPPAAATEIEPTARDVLQRIGAITRRLHDALAELGYDQTLARAVESLPDARARLSYIARLAGESAERVLDTVECARAAQDQMKQGAGALATRWTGRTAPSLAAPDGEALVADTKEFLGSLSMSSDLVNRYLTEIMIAQDFHDLTGQVVRKVADLAQTLEEQLLELLLATTPQHRRARTPMTDPCALAGPAIHTEGRTDVVTSQSQVDDLLESLGF
jgi:chemotaxis protein CheZ